MSAAEHCTILNMTHVFQTILSKKVVNRLQTDSLKQCIVTRTKIPRRLMVRLYVAVHETNDSRIILPSSSFDPKGFGIYLTPVKSIVSSIFQNKNKHLTGKRNKGSYIERFDELHFLRKQFHFKAKLDRIGFGGPERKKLKMYIKEHDPLIIPHENMGKVVQRLLRDEVKTLFETCLTTSDVIIEPCRSQGSAQSIEDNSIVKSCTLHPRFSTLFLLNDDANYIFGGDVVSADEILKVVVNDSCPRAFDLISICLRLCYMNDIRCDSMYPESFLHSFSTIRSP